MSKWNFIDENWLRTSEHQRPNRRSQLDALKQAGCERIYQEVASEQNGKAGIDRLLVDIRAGDTIVI
ncbi:hypothetical protein [Klebsiella pneumoniae]|uniref:hypothetical protein n=1 Tax=Klebsiella pneumoniae TaxID=573 RepID=UPI0023B2484F|nr:hypothetical protein [Klebsiella pneumoniae]